MQVSSTINCQEEAVLEVNAEEVNVFRVYLGKCRKTS